MCPRCFSLSFCIRSVELTDTPGPWEGDGSLILSSSLGSILDRCLFKRSWSPDPGDCSGLSEISLTSYKPRSLHVVIAPCPASFPTSVNDQNLSHVPSGRQEGPLEPYGINNDVSTYVLLN